MVAHRLNGILSVYSGYLLSPIGPHCNCQSIVDMALGQMQPLHPSILGDVSPGLTDRDMVNGVRFTSFALPSFSRWRAFAGEQGIKGRPCWLST